MLTLENIVPHISSINLKILPSLIQDEEILSMNYLHNSKWQAHFQYRNREIYFGRWRHTGIYFSPSGKKLSSAESRKKFTSFYFYINFIDV